MSGGLSLETQVQFKLVREKIEMEHGPRCSGVTLVILILLKQLLKEEEVEIAMNTSQQTSRKALKISIYCLAESRDPASAKIRNRGSVPEKRQITKLLSAK